MKHIYFSFLFMSLMYGSLNAQPLTASFTDNSAPVLSEPELNDYRKSIWEMPPAAEGWVNDFAGLFTSEDEIQLESLLAYFEKNSGVEIAIISIDSLMVEKEKMEDFSTHLLKTWGIGKLAKDNGILICICRDYRMVKIVSGAGAGQYLVGDGKQNLTDLMIPFFMRQRYFEGTLHALKAIIKNSDSRVYGTAMK